MKAKIKQELIISLIQDDLIHAKLVYGMIDLGLRTDGYFMDLSNTIITLMGFTGIQNEEAFMHYLDRQKQVKYIDISTGSRAIQTLAYDIYCELQKHDTYEEQ